MKWTPARCMLSVAGGWSEGESDGEKWWGVNSVQSEKQSGFPGVQVGRFRVAARGLDEASALRWMTGAKG